MPKSVELNPAIEMREMITGFWLSQAIYVAAKLNLAELIGDSEKSSDELSRICQTNSEMIYRLLRALASRGIFKETSPGKFVATSKSNWLRETSRGSLRHYAIMYGEEAYQNFSSLYDAVVTGEVAFPQNFGQPFFDYLKSHPESGETFRKAMIDISQIQAISIAEDYDFSNIESLVDIGGGSGTVLFELMRKYPNLKGTVFDLPEVVNKAKDNTPIELQERCDWLSGDFFKTVPRGADAYLLKYILHDWPDEACITLLRQCRDAAHSKTKLLIVEQVISAGNEPLFAKLADLHMHLILGAKERTADHFDQLLKQSGFECLSMKATQNFLTIIEARPTLP